MSPATARKLAPRESGARESVSPGGAMETWIAQFIHAGADGRALVTLMTIEAASEAAARAFAARHAPAEEFMVSLHRRSAEQFLGQVRLQAMAATDGGKR